MKLAMHGVSPGNKELVLKIFHVALANRFGIFLIGLATTMLCGCGGELPLSKTSFGSTGWDTKQSSSVPGVDRANLKWFRQNNTVHYVVWSDLEFAGTASGGGGTTGAELYEHETEIKGPGDKKLLTIRFKSKVQDSAIVSPGTITIDEQTLDLNAGKLLLVSTDEAPPTIRQLKLSKESVQKLTGEFTEDEIVGHFQEMATTSEIQSFFRSVEEESDRD